VEELVARVLVLILTLSRSVPALCGVTERTPSARVCVFIYVRLARVRPTTPRSAPITFPTTIPRSPRYANRPAMADLHLIAEDRIDT